MSTSCEGILLADGRYRVEAEAGSGTYAIVYRAEDVASGARVAMKVMKQTTARRAARAAVEWRALASVSHDAIPRALDSGVLPDGRAFIVLEWCEGTSLRTVLGRGPIEMRDALAVSVNVAKALVAIHGAGMLHRDLKPDNILIPVTHDGLAFAGAKLLDFGICGDLGASPNGDLLMKAGRVSGSAGYMAPEQLLGRPQTTATDLFGLGVVMYELIYRRLPLFVGRRTPQYVIQVDGHRIVVPVQLARLDQEATMPSEPAVPALVAHIVTTALRRDPQERFQSAPEMLVALEQAARMRPHDAV